MKLRIFMGAVALTFLMASPEAMAKKVKIKNEDLDRNGPQVQIKKAAKRQYAKARSRKASLARIKKAVNDLSTEPVLHFTYNTSLYHLPYPDGSSLYVNEDNQVMVQLHPPSGSEITFEEYAELCGLKYSVVPFRGKINKVELLIPANRPPFKLADGFVVFQNAGGIYVSIIMGRIITSYQNFAREHYFHAEPIVLSEPVSTSVSKSLEKKAAARKAKLKKKEVRQTLKHNRIEARRKAKLEAKNKAIQQSLTKKKSPRKVSSKKRNRIL